MRRFFFLFLLLPISAFGQFPVGVSFYGEQSLSNFQTGGINNFVNSFNDFWGSSLSEPFEEFSGAELSHANIGIGGRLISVGKVGFTMGSGFFYGWQNYDHYAMWSNNIQNRMALNVRDIQWSLTTGMHFMNTLYLEGYCGAHARIMQLAYTTVYPDGSESMSSEYRLNGLYDGLISSFDIGGQAGLRFGPVMLYLKYTTPLPGFPPGKGLVTMDDYDTPKFPPTDFPTDYRLWATDPIRYVEEDLGLKTDDFAGRRITFGIELILGAKNE